MQAVYLVHNTVETFSTSIRGVLLFRGVLLSTVFASPVRFTVALLNITSNIFTRKVHIEKNLYMGGFAEIYWKYNIVSVFFADTEKFFVH